LQHDHAGKAHHGHALEDLNVDIIEAGSPWPPRATLRPSHHHQAIRKPRIASLARAKTEDIEMAARALQFADRARIHIFLASSDLHLEYKLKIGRQEALDLTAESIRLARTMLTMSSSPRKTLPAQTATFWWRWCAWPSRPAPPPSICRIR